LNRPGLPSSDAENFWNKSKKNILGMAFLNCLPVTTSASAMPAMTSHVQHWASESMSASSASCHWGGRSTPMRLTVMVWM